MCRRAKFGRNRSNRGGDMTIFRLLKMVATAILDFQNFKLLTVRRLKRIEMRRHANFGQSMSKCGGHMTDVSLFKMAAAVILHFKIFEILMVEQLKSRVVKTAGFF